ncbi:TIGR00730 family Rossman fold protein [uncultured Eubacterium sp.]|uniref:LOG family protein n=1 Tax=uncultured Eubacterium sp. TaxID=165185 RepID=UPI0025DAE3D5|nr:TIGR00730 family Rossman fold protein [uncultured Eubacterium sp.]MCI6537693.1 TIGR00730 family Rossman fold protein [Lachnospiraceae bacterium]
MRLAVYCGSDFGKEPAYQNAARELGQWIGKCGHSLVYGGGESGLMGMVAREVHAQGQEVIGVVPGDVAFIKDRPQPYVTELITTANMSERKQKMLELADGFIALPGGIGTLDEITEVITLTKIGVFQKPCILFDRNGFYEPLKTLFERMEAVDFLYQENMKHVLFSDDVDEIGTFIALYDKMRSEC